MNKYLNILFFSLYSHFSLLNAQGQLDIDEPVEKMDVQNLSDFDLKGSVKSFSYLFYPEYKYPSVEKIDYNKEKPSRISYFDKLGLLTSEYWIDTLGNVDTNPYAYFKYDAQGRIIESKTYQYEDGSTYFTKCESMYCERSFYDETGKNLTSKDMIYLLNDGLIDKIVAEDGSLMDDYDYKKNSNGLIIEKIHTSYDGRKWKTFYTYNSKGLLIKRDNDGNPYYTFEYDENGRLVKECTYSGCSPLGNLGVIVCDCNYWKYNKNGDIISWTGEDMPNTRQVYSSEPHPLYSYIYEYDNNGNWTKKITNIDGEFAGMVLRIITYY